MTSVFTLDNTMNLQLTETFLFIYLTLYVLLHFLMYLEQMFTPLSKGLTLELDYHEYIKFLELVSNIFPYLISMSLFSILAFIDQVKVPFGYFIYKENRFYMCLFLGSNVKRV